MPDVGEKAVLLDEVLVEDLLGGLFISDCQDCEMHLISSFVACTQAR